MQSFVSSKFMAGLALGAICHLATATAIYAQGPFAIPADGTAVSTPVLARGDVYTLTVSGTLTVDRNIGRLADAEFIQDTGNNWWTDGALLDHGVTINGQKPKWGAYSSGHTYSILVYGTGGPLSLRYLDTKYTDNTGSLSASLVKATPVQTKVVVPANGSTVTVSNLKPGIRYGLRAYGTLYYNHSAGRIGDAEYIKVPYSGSTYNWDDDNPVADHGIMVNGVKIRWAWPDLPAPANGHPGFNAANIYCATVISVDTKMTFRYQDTKYTDNQGELYVDIYAGAPVSFGAGSPGTGGKVPQLELSGGVTPTFGWQYAGPGGFNRVQVALSNGLGGAPALLVIGELMVDINLWNSCQLLVYPQFVIAMGACSGSGAGNGGKTLSFPLSPHLYGMGIVMQAVLADPGVPCAVAMSNGVILNAR